MVIVIMGVCGTGKTTVGQAVADALGFSYAEGDSYHPVANVEKMRAGFPLNDEDRAPWLAAMATEIDAWLAADRGAVLACSALKRRYREQLIGTRSGVRLVYLHGDPALIRERMLARTDHYMPASLLDSQLDTLEPPQQDEHPIALDIAISPASLSAQITSALKRETHNGI